MKLYGLLLPIALVLSSCQKEPAHRAAEPERAAAPVHTATVSAEDWPATYEATGTVRARTTATISSKVMGYVQQVSVQAGDRVRAGQLLVTLDARDLDVSLRRAEAGRSEVESAIPEAENAAAAAKASLDLARATFGRMEELAGKRSISRQEMDEASARLKAAQANYEMTRARRVQLNAKVAGVEQEVRAAEILRDYTKLTAPFSGVVVTRTVEPGSLATPGTPLLTLEQDGPYRLEAAVEESKLGSVRVGQMVGVVVEDRQWNARVAEIVPAVDPGSRTYIVKVELAGASPLRTGMFGRAVFPLGAQKVASIPAGALVERGQLQSVFVVEDGVAHTRLVTTGRRNANAAEALSGVNAGERVILAPPPGLRDGARVEVRP